MGMDGMRFIASCGDSGVGRGYPCPRGSQDTACIKNTRRGNATAVDIKYRVVAGIDGGNQAASVRPRIGGRQRAVPDRDQGSVSGCLECAFVSGDHRVFDTCSALGNYAAIRQRPIALERGIVQFDVVARLYGMTRRSTAGQGLILELDGRSEEH